MLSSIYLELTRFIRDARYLINFLALSDRLAVICAVFMLFGVFLPWLSIPGALTQMGLMGGGDAHMVLAFLTMYRAKRVTHCHLKMRGDPHDLALVKTCLRRVSLSYLLIGACSTVFAILTLSYFGWHDAAINGVMDVRFGFYVTAFSGAIIFFCGLERFMR